MKKMKFIITVLTIFISFSSVLAQTKKPAPKKKSPPKPVSVYICASESDKLFHKRRTCAGLNKCNSDIKHISSVAELKKWKRKSCARCNK